MVQHARGGLSSTRGIKPYQSINQSLLSILIITLPRVVWSWFQVRQKAVLSSVSCRRSSHNDHVQSIARKTCFTRTWPRTVSLLAEKHKIAINYRPCIQRPNTKTSIFNAYTDCTCNLQESQFQICHVV